MMAAAAGRVAPIDVYESDEFAKHQISVPEKRGWKKLAAIFGPGFLVCIAYVDPANFQSDLQAGADYKMELLWIILVATISGLIIQSLAARLGVVTRKHLAEHCRLEYSRKTTILLWLLAEVTIIASDIPEVIGTAFALNILFKLPIWAGVLVTGLSTLLLLALQQYGVRKLEFVIAFFVIIMAVCFFVEMGYVKPDAKQVLRGIFVPTLKGDGATGLAISLLGAMIMPHNLFLHSALVLTRRIPFNAKAIKDACWFYTFETGFALLISFMINVAVISVSATVCNGMQLSAENQAKCGDLDLNEASFLLKNVLGKWSRIVFGIAILASGQSSTITGTYAGQYVMQGFLNLRYQAWVRNLITRSVAIIPSLAVALLGGSSGAGKLIIVCSMILAFQLPFTLVPLIKFTSSETKMGRHVSHKAFTIITWLIGCGVLGINVYYVISSFIKWILHGTLMKGGRIVIGILGFCAIAMYLTAVAYLAIRTEKPKTFNPPSEDEDDTKFHEDLSRSEPHISLPREDIKQLRLPHEILP